MHKQLRIAFIGASGTGKTTLANILGARYAIPFNPVGARSVASAMGYGTPYDADRAGERTLFQQRLIADKMLWEKEHVDFVTDRTAIDNLVYHIMHAPAAVTRAHVDSAMRAMHRYTHILWCMKADFQKLSTDGFHVSSPVYHDAYEALTSHYMWHFVRAGGRAPIQVRGSTVESRIGSVEWQLPAGASK